MPHIEVNPRDNTRKPAQRPPLPRKLQFVVDEHPRDFDRDALRTGLYRVKFNRDMELRRIYQQEGTWKVITVKAGDSADIPGSWCIEFYRDGDIEFADENVREEQRLLAAAQSATVDLRKLPPAMSELAPQLPHPQSIQAANAKRRERDDYVMTAEERRRMHRGQDIYG